MAQIRSKNTQPEILVRSELHRMGLRFRLHAKALPGRPDIVLPRWRTAIFVHGCFWHRHTGCRWAYSPKSRVPFWESKFAGNVARDRRSRAALARLGWRVVVLWECQAVDPSRLGRLLRRYFETPPPRG